MINFLKTAAVLTVAIIIMQLVAKFFFPHAMHILLDTQQVTFASEMVSFFVYITSAVITFLILSSEDTPAHVLIYWALFSFKDCVFNDMPFKYVVFGYIPVIISVVVAKVFASKIRGAVFRQ